MRCKNASVDVGGRGSVSRGTDNGVCKKTCGPKRTTNIIKLFYFHLPSQLMTRQERDQIIEAVSFSHTILVDDMSENLRQLPEKRVCLRSPSSWKTGRQIWGCLQNAIVFRCITTCLILKIRGARLAIWYPFEPGHDTIPPRILPTPRQLFPIPPVFPPIPVDFASCPPHT